MPSLRPLLRRPRALAVLLAFAALGAAACAADDETTAPGAARLTIDSTSLTFGTRTDDSIPTRTVRVRNVGDGESVTLQVGLAAGTTSDGFLVASPTTGSCGTHRLLPGASCTVTVTLGGRASGPQNGTLIVFGGGDVGQSVSAALTGLIRSDFTIAFAGTGRGTVRADPVNAAVGCVGGGCTTTGAGASCTASCGLRFESAVATLVATPDASSRFDGFVRAPIDTQCAGGATDRCTLALTDLNSIVAVFTAK